MTDCKVVQTSPDRPNIYYDVHRKTDIETDMECLVSSLKELQNKASRVIVYCRTLDVCADLYAHFHFELGDRSYYPAGVEQVSANRLFEMYHANTPQHNKDVILTSLANPGGILRILFATVALGMGINLRDVNTVIHYGAPNSIDDFFQESGRGGRSGVPARSTMYWQPLDLRIHRKAGSDPRRVEELAAVRNYLENDTSCRRLWLLHHFDPTLSSTVEDPAACCDVCARSKCTQ